MKERLEEKEVPVSQQWLAFEGKWMENDSRTMTDYGITAGKTLHMVVHVRVRGNPRPTCNPRLICLKGSPYYP